MSSSKTARNGFFKTKQKSEKKYRKDTFLLFKVLNETSTLPFRNTLLGPPRGDETKGEPTTPAHHPARGQSAQLGASGTPGASPSAAAAAEGETEAAPQPEGGLPTAPPWDWTNQLARPLRAAKP